ncbi:762_t:CDS:2, partial [Gigaspora margarita]
IIRELLLEFTQFTLAPTLPADFLENLFDYYLENAFPVFEDPDISPISRSNTVYPIHPEETDPVPPVIVDINPPNEEPIRTLTPEALLVNQPDPVNEALLPLLPPIQNPPPPSNIAQAQALTDATNAINALAVALGQ